MELFDLYDQNRLPLGQTMQRGTKQPVGTFRLVAHVCIFSGEGKLLCQHRQPFKKGWSDMWDVSASGGIISGETSEDGARREVAEELGLYLPQHLLPALTVHFNGGFDDWYCVNADVDLTALSLREEEVCEVAWFSREEVLQAISDGTFVPYEESLIDLAFTLRTHRGAFKKRDISGEKKSKKNSELMIHAKRLYVAKLKVSDAPQAFKWCSDPEVTKYLRHATYTEIEPLQQWIASHIDDKYTFGVFLNDGTPIGSISCCPRSRGSALELGYSFNKDYWGHGYATEASKALLGYCAEHLGTKDFWAVHATENTRSGRVIEKCGFYHIIDSAYSKKDGSETFPAREYAMRVNLHRMNVDAEPFEKIADGQKTVELRLNDEKRRTFAIGDYVALECDEDKIVAKITDLRKYENFAALYEAEDLTKCGYTEDEAQSGFARAENMLRYYSAEKQQQYGALAIELEVLATY